ncbi:cellulose biosynthesis cyclic di-GMP-binding regulatory protein BcsB [Noviherbaspirillum sp. CPCC 100848]|uniref:Cyclic di-GMP-binding protein n=1 Tax=Noviherbaspirillum album TaxID=3080276 RepID=A0ABU6J8P8_9BURK|nr:cellulose biosynthesis cyclic di-GMP-binding regulatory protein BcsB [Noviherbaspirillum sp. CPCC 100848]MEC4719808.1 cellulose biosynthesis cyclic di-GMP-binding regulatory protein BcsB [Noviherbaspirillum sp. CPCC 100848]
MIFLRILGVLFLLLGASQPMAQSRQADKPAATGAAAPAVPAAVPAAVVPQPTSKRNFGFSALDSKPLMRLVPTDGPPSIGFGLRRDEKPVKAVFRIKNTFSPALIPEQSHIRVLLNQEVVGTVQMNRQTAGKQTSKEFELDPTLLREYNNLTLEFVGHYTNECEDPLHTNLWADIGKGSEVELTVQRVRIEDDLALLPEPFFDKQELIRLKLPYVFAAKPSHATLRAAGITASWFGKLAGWRNARFPAHLDSLPAGHAVVFATNAERPAFLATEPPFAGPALRIMANPSDGISKLLLVSGADADDLAVAARSLVLGNAALSGRQAEIRETGAAVRRKPYDAPNWVRVDRPMKFGELIDSPQQLQVYGHVPEPVRVSLRIPPDLFTWRSRGVPVDLKFRYTPPVRTIDSMLGMSINGELVQSVNLRSTGQGGESARVILPLLDGGLLGDSREMLIPAFKLGSRNQLQYAFSFSYHTAGNCRDTQIENIRAMIDSDSRIDFSGYPHYAEMPHLGYFSTAGYPFTKYADLSETVIVLPENVSATDIEVMLSLLGRMGESTGHPATYVQVTGPKDEAQFVNRDLLVIGPERQQAFLDKWRRLVPAVITGPQQKVMRPENSLSWFNNLLDDAVTDRRAAQKQKHLRGDGPLAAMLGFESPYTAGRSVVVVTSAEPGDAAQVLDTLNNDDIAKTLHGSVVLMHGGVVESIFAGKTYAVGELPIWTAIWFPLSDRPVLLAIMSVIAVLVFAFALWRSLRAVAARRLRESGE